MSPYCARRAGWGRTLKESGNETLVPFPISCLTVQVYFPVLSSHGSYVNAIGAVLGTDIRCCTAARYGKGVNHHYHWCFLKHRTNYWVLSPAPSDLLQIRQTISAKFHLVPVVANFIHSGFYIPPNEKVSFILTLRHDCYVQSNADSDPSFHLSFLEISLQDCEKIVFWTYLSNCAMIWKTWDWYSIHSSLPLCYSNVSCTFWSNLKQGKPKRNCCLSFSSLLNFSP